MTEEKESHSPNSTDVKWSVCKKYFKWLLICLIMGLVALYVGNCANFNIPPQMLQVLRFIGALPAVVGACGMSGWEIQTMSGNTFPERLNRTIPKILIVIGFSLTVFMFALEEGLTMSASTLKTKALSVSDLTKEAASEAGKIDSGSSHERVD